MTLASAAFTAAFNNQTNEDTTEDTVEVDIQTLARELEKNGEYDMAIRLRRSSRPPRPAN
jgi:hypothetical protein